MCLCKLFTFVNILLVASGSVVYPCLTPNQESAFCISLFSCPVLMKSLGTLKNSSISFIKQSICTTMSSEEFPVCCGSTGNFQSPNVDELEDSYESCKPSSPSPSSSSLQPPSSSPPPQSANKPLASSELGGSSNLSDSVTPSKPTEPVKLNILQHRDFVKNELLPTRKYCGLQHTDDRIYEENAIALDEYPWLVHVTFIPEEKDPMLFVIRCNGVLINRRYVLTSSYCGLDSSSVRLGQYNTNKSISCVDNPDFVECTEPWLVVEVEESIQRDNFTTNFTVNDFALLRLTKNVTYTDYIRPICLPLDEPKQPPEFYSFSGWGTTENIAGYKKRLRYKPTNLSECYALDMHKDHQIGQIGKEFYKASKDLTPFCLLPKDENGELTCMGDEAGPIMYPRKFQWFADGIITRIYYPLKDDIYNRCSNKLPVAGLKITPDILDWMFDNIRP